MLALILVAALAATKPCYAALDSQTEKELPRFVKMSVSDMNPDYIEHMLSIDPADVPAKHRKAFDAKRLELYTMKQLGEGKRKGTIRMPDKACSVPKEAKSEDIKVLQMAGYLEIYENEMVYLETNTHCTERQMACEFSLQVVHEHVPGKKEVRTRYFLHSKDPLMALVGQYRESGGHHDTNFFGQNTFPQCS